MIKQRRKAVSSIPRALLLSLTALTAVGASARAQTFTPLRPPAAPLITRGPYLNVWLRNNTGIAPRTWPQHWDGSVKAITGIANIDGTPYLFLGAPGTPAIPKTMTQTSLQTTATQSIFTFNAGGVNLTVDFLSPVEAKDIRRLSIPLSDIVTTAKSSDGATHNVTVYFDISGEWASGLTGAGNTPALINWAPETIPLNSDGTSAPGNLSAWTVHPTDPLVFRQDNNFADWGTVLWATKSVAGIETQSGADAAVRTQFVNNGTLTGANDTNQPRAINNNFPVFAFAKPFGNVGTTATAPFTLLLGRVRDPAINYLGNPVRSLWTQYWPSYEAMLAFAYKDSTAAIKRADTLDANLASASNALGGPTYSALTALTLRQAFGATEMTNTISNPYMFVEEISSSDNVSTVDILYPSMPAFLYTNPELVRYMIEPVIDYSESGQWPALYSPHDLGATYPNAVGHNDGGGENMPVEETANMLIMADAYMQHVSPAEAATYANAHYALFKQWANYLLTVPAGATYANAVDPQFQNQTDDFAGFVAHSVNLALKGISGVDAFAQIANFAGVKKDANYYRNQAEIGISTWAQLSQNTAGTHLLHTYREPANAYSPDTTGEADTDWSLLYNSYPNNLLHLNLIPQAILAEEAAFYITQEHPLGVPLQPETLNEGGVQTTIAKSDWDLWTAAGLENATLQQNIIDEIYTYAGTVQSGTPFSDLYDPTGVTNYVSGFQARPVQGGIFAPLTIGK